MSVKLTDAMALNTQIDFGYDGRTYSSMALFFLIAALLAGSSVDSRSTLIGVLAAKDRSPLILLGITAMGSDASLAAVESQARAAHFKAERLPRDNREETMVIFPPNSSRSLAVSLLRRAEAGEFGKLELEVVVVSPAAAADGIDFDTEVTAEPVDYIVPPVP